VRQDFSPAHETWSAVWSRIRRAALPFCHVRIRTAKTRTDGYPSHPRTLGEHLRRQRIDLGHTQRQVAEQIGVNASTIRSWENGSNQPRLAARPGLYAYFGFCPANPSASLGERLRLWREARGSSLRALAGLLKLDEGTLGRLERGVTDDPTERVRTAVASILAPTGAQSQQLSGRCNELQHQECGRGRRTDVHGLGRLDQLLPGLQGRDSGCV